MSDLVDPRIEKLAPAEKAKWLGLSSNYDDLNSKLNGLPDVVRKVNGTIGEQGAQPGIEAGSATEKLASLNKGLYGSLPFGIGDWILKKTQPAQYAAMEQAAKNNPGWNTAGAIGGGLSQGIIAPALGAGTLAGAATKTAGNIIGRNVLNAAVASAPNAITQAASGDIGGAAKNFALSTGAGAALGSAAEGIANKLPDILQSLKTWAQKRGVGSAGIGTRDMRKALTSGALGKYPGTTINNADDEVNALWTTLKKTGAFGEKSQEKLFGEQGEVWNQLAGGFNDNKVKLTNPVYKGGILSDPEIQALMGRTDIGTPEAIQSMAEKTIAGIDSGANYNAKKKIADEIIKRGFSSTVTGDVRAQATIAQIVKKNIDDIAGTFSPQLDVAGMKYNYHTMKPLFTALSREKLKIPAAEAGSPTAARAFTKNLLMGGGEGGAGGLILGASTTSQDDPDRWRKILQTGVGGILLGGAANKLIPKLFNKLGGQGIGRLSDIITPGGIAAASNLAGTIAPQISTMAGKVSPQAVNETIAQANAPISDTGALGDTVIGQAPAEPIENAPVQGAPAVQASMQEAPVQQPAPQPVAPQPEAQAAPQAPPPAPSPVEQAQGQFSATTQTPPNKIGEWNGDVIEQSMQRKYNEYIRKYGRIVEYEPYKAQVLQATDNMNPMNEYTWKRIYADQGVAAKMYKDYLALQKMPLESPTFVADALNHYRGGVLGIRADPLNVNEKMKEQNRANDVLVQALMDITKQDKKTIDARLKELAFDNGLSGDKKKQLVANMIAKEGGIDWNTFHKMGLL